MKTKTLRIKLIVFCIFVLLAMVVGKYYMDGKKGNSVKFTEAQAAKSVALLYFDGQQCQGELKDNFGSGEEKQWYEKYVNILLDNKPEIKFFKPKHGRMNSSLTYKETEELLNDLGIEKEDTGNLLNGKPNKEVDHMKWFKIYSLIVEKAAAQNPPEKCEITIAGMDEEVITDRGILSCEGQDISSYLDTRAEAFIKDGRIIAIGDITEKTVVYKNVWINSSDGEKISTIFNGKDRAFTVAGLKDKVSEAVADITVENHKVIAMSVKQDKINGKVLEINDSTVEIESFGKLELDDGFRVYKHYDNVEETDKNSILVGYDVQSFIVAQGKVCAAIINSAIMADNIRVLITNTGFKSKYHNSVSMTCDTDYKVCFGESVEDKPAGEVINITADSQYLAAGRVRIEPSGEGRVQILSIERAYGNPVYRGCMEVASSADGLLVVNDVSLEHYLYSVVPSEMPVSYGTEALKAQAVCARSYAYRHLLSNSCSQYGAHVDDSTGYQVYNNTKESPESIEAVDSTYGEVMFNGGEAISAYFFSTSCGSTTTSEIWGGGSLPYIKSRAVNETGEIADLTNEQNFDSFIRSDFDSYDSSFPWYRWKVYMSMDSLTNSINSVIGGLYSSAPEAVLTLNENGEFVSKPIETIGTLKKLSTGSRLPGGVLNEIILYGSDATVKIVRELNIRKILKPFGNPVKKKDGSENASMSMMPSAYFVADETADGDTIQGYEFVGGGYGHGAGMSQNAAKVMSEKMSFREILEYFYADIEITGIYQ